MNTTDHRIAALTETIKCYNNTAIKEVRAHSVSFIASPFAVDGPNGIRKHLPAGVTLKRVGEVHNPGYTVALYLARVSTKDIQVNA